MIERSTRLRELFLQEITRILSEVKDPGLSGFMTITDLELSKDRKTARVFYSMLGSAEDRQKTQKALDRCAPYIRKKMRGRLSIRTTPNLIFQFDDTTERASRIERLMDDLNNEDGTVRPSVELQQAQLDAIASKETKRRRKRGR
ncbi:MAG: ribosome-binding factor A [Elusimicrobia bacterium]|nr:MAG: ribosome-binding factor A [Elusimicrobiota bacterium]